MQQYREVFTAQGARLQRLRVWLTLAGLSEQVEAELGPVPDEVQQALAAGTAAYRACWWRKDDEANRRWINALHAMLLEVEEKVASHLTEAYQTPWKASRITVHVVPYVYAGGLFERGTWPAFQEPLDTWWKPYLKREIEMAAAAEGLLTALSK